MGRAVLLLLLALFATPAVHAQEGGADPAANTADEADAPAGSTPGEGIEPAPPANGGQAAPTLTGTAALRAHLLATLATSPAFAGAMEHYSAGRWVEAAQGFAALGARGNMWARFYLGDMYANGRGIPRNDAAAVEWLRPAAMAGLSPAQLAMAEVLERPGPQHDLETAAVLYRFAAPDLPRARYRLALMFLAGRGVPARPDLAAGMAHSAAQGGVSEAMLLFAHLLGEGVGIQPDRPEAVRWLQRAAWMATPRRAPLPTRPEDLLAWMHAAANDGNVAAQLALGMMLARGIGTPAEPDQGAFWLEQAGLRYRAMDSAHGTALALLELSLVRPDSPVIPRMAELVMPAQAAAASAPAQGNGTMALDEEALDEEALDWEALSGTAPVGTAPVGTAPDKAPSPPPAPGVGGP
ncbi:MAG: sel1 repeat family protein [Nitrospirae bacterium]|nr:sel1 repeat family protein [Nitrospirota bacterium]